MAKVTSTWQGIGSEIAPLRRRHSGRQAESREKLATRKVDNGVTSAFFGMGVGVANSAEVQDFAAAQLKQAFGPR